MLSVFLVACNQTKHVPQGKYLLKKNTVTLNKSELSSDDIEDIIRQKPNYSFLGMKLRLAAYNMVDSAKVADKRIVKSEKLHQKNDRRRAREKRINERRIAKANAKGREWYTRKVIPLKDTVNPNSFFREWLKYKFGEEPVIFDSSYYSKTIEQVDIFLRKKGYYYGEVSGKVHYDSVKRKVVPEYIVETGDRYYIDSVYLKCDNESVKNSFVKFTKKGDLNRLKGQPFDTDMLDDYREDVASLMRDEAYYGFVYSSIDFEADTNKNNFMVTLGIRIGDRPIQSPDFPDSIIYIPYKPYLISDVHFHILDTLRFKGDFSEYAKSKGVEATTNGRINTVDTMYFRDVYFNNDEKKNRNIDVSIDTANINRQAYFYFNGKPFIKPIIIEAQNYLEKDNYYKQYYLERTFSRLLQLGQFSTVTPELKEIEGTNRLEVHYYLTPSTKQNFSFEPKATNSNGFLGVSASANYNNRNLFRGAENLTFTLSGGLESQPAIFDKTLDGEKIKSSARSFNTFEFEPGVKLTLPGLFPIRSTTKLAKRTRAQTIIATAYNFQNRSDFNRKSFQLSYLWKFFGGGETQVFQVGFPLLSTIKYVNFSPSLAFAERLASLNDNFLLSTYSDQFIWQDIKITYEYNTLLKKDKRPNTANVVYKVSFDPAGNFISLFKKSQGLNDLGQRTIFGLGYSQFARLDNDIIYAQPLGKKKSLNMRFQIGAGIPYGNSFTSLPYDYGFFGGGANDNRGWRSRALGPGGYKYYLDGSRTLTQIADIRLAGSVEFRFDLGGYFKAAVFTDFGNIWTWKEDVNRPGAKFSSDFYKQIAVSGGVGLRMDLDFFVIRLDLGIPLSNPALPSGSQWIFQSRRNFYDEIETAGLEKGQVARPFIPVLHFGIGYPF